MAGDSSPSREGELRARSPETLPIVEEPPDRPRATPDEAAFLGSQAVAGATRPTLAQLQKQLGEAALSRDVTRDRTRDRG